MPAATRNRTQGFSISKAHDPAKCTKNARGECRCPWRGRVIVKVQGLPTRKVRYGRTKEAARKAVLELLAEEQSGAITSGGGVTLGTWLATWMTDVERTKKPNTIRNYRSRIHAHIGPHLGKTRLDRLSVDDLRAMYAGMRAKGLRESTLAGVHTTLGKALQAAKDEHRVQFNICRALSEPPVAEAAEVVALKLPEALHVLAVAGEDPRWWLALHGLRQGECLAMRWGALFLDAPEPYLEVRENVAWSGGVPSFGTPKTKKSARMVPLLPEIVARLRVAHAAALRDGRGGGGDLLFQAPRGGPLHPNVDRARWYRLLRKAEVPRVTLHSARHTTASLLEKAGVQPRVAGLILGHAHVAMTWHYQGSGDEEAVRTGMGQLGVLVSGQPAQLEVA